MALPAISLMIAFSYVPMYGAVLAFKDFNFMQGFNSPWCGLDNFKQLFLTGSTFWRMTRNTVGYFFLFLAVGTVAKIALAIGLNELRFKRWAKVTQSCMVLPHFISYIAIAFIVRALLEEDTGMITKWIYQLTGKEVHFYLEPARWPLILLIVRHWKHVGYGSILYLSVLVGIDPGLYEAADLDGATTWQKIRYVTIPMLSNMVIIQTILALGGIMTSENGLFYQVTGNSGALYPTTQVISTYILDALKTAGTDYGITGAVSLYQSVVGSIMIIVSNLIIRKIDPEKALF